MAITNKYQLFDLLMLFQDEHLHKNAFDPLAQHRDWCPWISVGKENVDPGAIPLLDGGAALHQQGWKAALDLLVPMKKNSNSAGSSPAQASQDSAFLLQTRKWCMGIHALPL